MNESEVMKRFEQETLHLHSKALCYGTTQCICMTWLCNTANSTSHSQSVMHEEGKQINPITDNFQFCQIADFWLVLTVVRICLCYWLYKTCWPKKLTTAIIDIWRWNTHGQNPTCTGLFLTNRNQKKIADRITVGLKMKQSHIKCNLYWLFLTSWYWLQTVKPTAGRTDYTFDLQTSDPNLKIVQTWCWNVLN